MTTWSSDALILERFIYN